MKVEIIIFPERLHPLLKNEVEIIVSKFEQATKNEVNIRYDFNRAANIGLNDIDFFLVFCFNLGDFEEIKNHSNKMILMDAVFPLMGDIITNYDFAGIICSRYFNLGRPLIFGFPEIAQKLNITPVNVPMIQSEKYMDILKLDSTPVELLVDYVMALYDENNGGV